MVSSMSRITAGGSAWYAPVCSFGAAVQLGSAIACSRRMRARAKAVMAAALYSTDRCIQRTALRRSWAGGSWASTGEAETSATIRTSAAIQRADVRTSMAAIIEILLGGACAAHVGHPGATAADS